jgi:hypothetical protein
MDADQLDGLKASLSRMNSDLTPASASGYGAPFMPTTPLTQTIDAVPGFRWARLPQFPASGQP